MRTLCKAKRTLTFAHAAPVDEPITATIRSNPVETAGSGKLILADVIRVRANDRDLIRTKGVMAGGACRSRAALVVGRVADLIYKYALTVRSCSQGFVSHTRKRPSRLGAQFGYRSSPWRLRPAGFILSASPALRRSVQRAHEDRGV
jgi:hypothetical protein